LVDDNLADIVKGIMYNQRRIASSQGIVGQEQQQDKKNQANQFPAHNSSSFKKG
jgi:hypothetical protein